MGVHLTPILKPRVLRLEELRGRSFAVDGNNVLYQFLALIRRPDGTPLTDREGRVTSHLVGLFYRTTRLLSDYDLDLVFVFDGRPDPRKRTALDARRRTRQKAEREYAEAVERGDMATAWSKAVTSSRLRREQVGEAQRLLTLLGIPWVQAPSEGEAQAAHLARNGEVWAVSTRDYDALLYGTPRLLRYLTVSGREWLPSQGRSRPLEPELLELEAVLRDLGLRREQLVDLAILVGTDYHPGVKGVGPKRALDLLREHGRLEDLSAPIREALPGDVEALRRLFLDSPVTDDYDVTAPDPDPEGVVAFLCDDRDFDPERVAETLARMERQGRQVRLDAFRDG